MEKLISIVRMVKNITGMTFGVAILDSDFVELHSYVVKFSCLSFIYHSYILTQINTGDYHG